MSDANADLAFTPPPPRDPITEEQLVAQLRKDALWLTEHTSTATNGIVRRLLTAASLIERITTGHRPPTREERGSDAE